MKQTLFALSDIHGRPIKLKDFIDLGFDISNENHHIILLGDYFDRYPNNPMVLKFCLDLKAKIKERAHFLYGNHDDYLQRFVNEIYNQADKIGETIKLDPDLMMRWSRNGGQITIRQLFGGIKRPAKLTLKKLEKLKKIQEFLDLLEPYFETNHYIFTHAGINAQRDIDFWDRELIFSTNPTTKTIVAGHTTFDSLLKQADLIKVAGPLNIGSMVVNSKLNNKVNLIDNGQGNNIVVFSDTF